MYLPNSQTLDIAPLSRIFSNTSAAYKFFWFLCLLEVFQKGQTEIAYSDIVARMIAKAWYPRLFFKLSFGKTESLAKWIDNLQIEEALPIDAKEDFIVSALINSPKNSSLVKSAFKQIADEVPYRFLMPWIKEQSNSQMVKRSQNFENQCLYSLKRDRIYGLIITINPLWQAYLRANHQILIEFTYWHLSQYLQARNPNVPGIPSKLMRPEKRASLARQRDFWKEAIGIQGKMHCIYTGRSITPEMSFDLDHFMPWRFVAHDRLWNLIPIANIEDEFRLNSCKSDYLPSLERFLQPLADEHLLAIQAIIEHGKRPKVMEDYVDLGLDCEDLKTISSENFFEAFSKTYTPMNLIAKNMGIEVWNFQ